jgi:hypothetical protein
MAMQESHRILPGADSNHSCGIAASFLFFICLPWASVSPDYHSPITKLMFFVTSSSQLKGSLQDEFEKL